MNPDNIIQVNIPYSETVYGDLFVTCEKPSGVSSEDFIKGCRDGSIDPLDYSTMDEWIPRNYEDLSIEYEEAEEIL